MISCKVKAGNNSLSHKKLSSKRHKPGMEIIEDRRLELKTDVRKMVNNTKHCLKSSTDVKVLGKKKSLKT